MQSSPLPCHLVPLRPKYSPQHPILKHPQPMFFPQCERPSVTPIQSNRQNYSSVYNFGVAKWKTKKLRLMIAGIALLQSALNFFLNNISNCLNFPKISELYQPFREFITHLYTVICKLHKL